MNTLLNLLHANYAMRAAKILPDAWYWADTVLLKCGYNYGLFGQPAGFKNP